MACTSKMQCTGSFDELLIEKGMDGSGCTGSVLPLKTKTPERVGVHLPIDRAVQYSAVEWSLLNTLHCTLYSKAYLAGSL